MHLSVPQMNLAYHSLPYFPRQLLINHASFADFEDFAAFHFRRRERLLLPLTGSHRVTQLVL